MPNNGYFSIKRDDELIAAGGFFWCEACVVARPMVEQSPDPRYCLSCFDVLKVEVEMQPTRRAAWIPKSMSHKTTPGATEVAPVRQEVVAKIVPPIIPPVTEKKGIMQQRGRPRKEGEVHRATRWRRQKKAEQGVLV